MKQGLIKRTLEDVLRHSGKPDVYSEPMDYGGMEDEGISAPILDGAAMML